MFQTSDTTDCKSRDASIVTVIPEPPVIVPNGQTEVVVTEGQEAILTCEVSGIPPPTLTWARPDMGHTPVTPEDPRIKVHSLKEFYFFSIPVNDQVLYPACSLFFQIFFVTYSLLQICFFQLLKTVFLISRLCCHCFYSLRRYSLWVDQSVFVPNIVQT